MTTPTTPFIPVPQQPVPPQRGSTPAAPPIPAPPGTSDLSGLARKVTDAANQADPTVTHLKNTGRVSR